MREREGKRGKEREREEDRGSERERLREEELIALKVVGDYEKERMRNGSKTRIKNSNSKDRKKDSINLLIIRFPFILLFSSMCN